MFRLVRKAIIRNKNKNISRMRKQTHFVRQKTMSGSILVIYRLCVWFVHSCITMGCLNVRALQHVFYSQQSAAVERAINGCRWFDASERFKKYVLFVIMRSQKVVRLSAGNFFAVSLEGFANVMHWRQIHTLSLSLTNVSIFADLQCTGPQIFQKSRIRFKIVGE